MTPLASPLESALAGTQRRFKWLRFLRYLAFMGLAVVAAVLLLGVLMVRGWPTSTGAAYVLFGAVFGLAALALPALALIVLVIDRSREWSAGKIEDANPSLLDRLHTLVFLKSREDDDPLLDAYGRRIERQAIREMILASPPFDDEQRRLRRLWLAFVWLVLLTGLFYQRFDPFEQLRMASLWDSPVRQDAENPLLDAPIADAAELQADEEEPAWGEVRIVEPGRDLKVTKVDVVPLRIEMATSHPLKAAGWVTALTGAEPLEHDLPPPEEPRFAVYAPYLYVDELRLADWDVVTYYAEASTASDAYASDVYFLEVRPFREEIEKLSGAAGSQGADWMSQCSGLIDRQKHVLRQTHRFLARSTADDEIRRQDQAKLAEAEAELTEAVRHLYAQMAAEMENQAIANVLDHLALAEEELEEATAALEEDPSTAPPPEQSALAELVATRKNLQRAISDDPSAFSEKSPDDEPFPIAEAPDKLKQISEFRDEEKAARELLEELTDEQRRIGEELAQDPSTGNCKALAPSQGASGERLSQFTGDHPRPFEGAEDEVRRAEEALDSMRQALEQRDPDLAHERQDEALEALEELREEVERQGVQRQLQDAYKLKEMLERQAEKMGEVESNPGAVSGAEAGAAAAAAKETTRELKEMMEGSPVGQGFGPELHEALSDERQGELERELDAVGEAGSEGERSQAAKQAREGLEEISDAFEKSAPKLVRELREEDALADSDAEALENAIRLLQALESGQGGSSSASDATRRREALMRLQDALEGHDGNAVRVAALLEEAEETLERDDEVDPVKLRRLLAQLERYRAELGGVEVEQVELDLAHVDPAELPAEYRERIQNYFKKLSERR